MRIETMKRSRLIAAVLAAAVLGLGSALVPGSTASGGTASAVGPQATGLLGDGRLVTFSLTDASVLAVVPLGGVNPGTRLVGIDVRVQDGQLYGVGSDGAVYKVFSGAGVATLDSQLTVPLNGSQFGVDFNPAADRLRIISDTGQNLRHDLNTDTTVQDSTLSYTPPTPALGLSAAAYTNNDLDPTTGTTLFDIDTALDQVVIQAPPNAGTLQSTGSLGIDSRAQAGFDIQSTLVNGRADRNRAFATLRVPGKGVQLFRVNVLTGKATLVGSFPRNRQVVDLALEAVSS